MTEWFRRKSEKIQTTLKKDTKEGEWIKCPNCNSVLSKKIVKEQYYCCRSCDFHFRMSSDDYIGFILDSNYTELWKDIKSLDPLNFVASKSYKEQIETSIEKTRTMDAVRIIDGEILFFILRSMR